MKKLTNNALRKILFKYFELKDLTPHKNLDAWKLAMDLVTEVYKVTADLPDSEKYGLRSQMRRAAVSVPSNIAEGSSGRSKQHFINFLTYAVGSLAELETQLEISLRLNFLHPSECEPLFRLIIQCKQVTQGLKRSLVKKA